MARMETDYDMGKTENARFTIAKVCPYLCQPCFLHQLISVV